jgi:hypothetical protein
MVKMPLRVALTVDRGDREGAVTGVDLGTHGDGLAGAERHRLRAAVAHQDSARHAAGHGGDAKPGLDGRRRRHGRDEWCGRGRDWRAKGRQGRGGSQPANTSRVCLLGEPQVAVGAGGDRAGVAVGGQPVVYSVIVPPG